MVYPPYVVLVLAVSAHAKVGVDATELQRAIKDAQIVGDYLTFTLTNEMLSLETSGDSGEVTIEIAEFTDPPKVKEKQTAIYSLEFLNDILGALVADKVAIEFSTEMPIHLKFDLEHNGFLRFFLAPRVEEEEKEEDEDAEGEKESEEEGEKESEEEGEKESEEEIEEEEEAEEKPEKPKSAKKEKKEKKPKPETKEKKEKLDEKESEK